MIPKSHRQAKTCGNCLYSKVAHYPWSDTVYVCVRKEEIPQNFYTRLSNDEQENWIDRHVVSVGDTCDEHVPWA